MLLLMEGLRNHNSIIPHLLRKNKGNFDEKSEKIIDRTTADFLPGACRTGAEG